MRDGRLEGQFPYLETGRIYLDWTGAAQPPASLIRWQFDRDMGRMLGNPHSPHEASVAASEDVLEARHAVLDYFRADEAEYDVIFTSGATAAIKLLHHVMWMGGELLLTADNHNSMHGMRAKVLEGGGKVRYAPLNPDLSIDGGALEHLLSHPVSTRGPRILGFPSKSNYSGHLHSLNWVTYAQERGWRVIVDAAAHVANHRLDLSVVKPDFVPVSFYKMFGTPTGLGCLLIRKSAYRDMHKVHFAGGAIVLVSVADPSFHVSEPASPALYEDGTIDFRGIPAVTEGLRFRDALDKDGLAEHATQLGTWLHGELSSMEVGDGRPLVYSPSDTDIVMLNLEHEGVVIPPWEYEAAAKDAGFMVRLGCVCNPGANECNLGYGIDDFRALERLGTDARRQDLTVWKLQEAAGNQAVGGVRASMGYMNTQADVEAFAEFTRGFLDGYVRPVA